MGKIKKKVFILFRRRLHKENGKIVLRTYQKRDEEIHKALANDGKRRKKYRKIPPSWISLGRRTWSIDNSLLAIWICIHRRLCQRRDMQLCYKIYHKKRRKAQRLYTNYPLQRSIVTGKQIGRAHV